MSDIKFRFKKGENEVEVDLKDVDNKYVETILAQSFQIMNLEVAIDDDLAKLHQQTHKAFQDFYGSINNREDELHEHNVTKKKKLELKDDTDKNNQNEEKNDKDEDTNDSIPNFYETGIKIKNGKEMYKCHYWCPCGDSANHYIPPKTMKVNCFNCGMSLKVEEADKDEGFPTRDDYGNYFIAKQKIVT